MANKVYTIVKDGEELEKLKTLPAAKRLADAEGAEVYSDGQCVYQGKKDEEVENAVTPENVGTEEVVQPVEDGKEDRDEQVSLNEEPVRTVQEITRYRLKNLMNVRKKPSLDAEIKTTKPAGTIVRVFGIEDDWLHLVDDTFILFSGGRLAEKV